MRLLDCFYLWRIWVIEDGRKKVFLKLETAWELGEELPDTVQE